LKTEGEITITKSMIEKILRQIQTRLDGISERLTVLESNMATRADIENVQTSLNGLSALHVHELGRMRDAERRLAALENS
jgi:hypothetical protein